MVRRCVRLLFHPATVLALIALFVGAAGGAFATASGLIGSPQIKDHSIKLIDLSPQAVRGLQGRVGPQGPTGTFDPTKVTVVKGQGTLVRPFEEKGSSVQCPSGSVAVGGGAEGGADLLTSSPLTSASNRTPTGWQVFTINRYPNDIAFLTPVAVCAAP
jgi:hypothetical protein